MYALKKLTAGAAIITGIFALAACGGGGDGSGTAASGGSGTAPGGTAALGFVNNGIVTLKDGAGNTLTTTPAQVLTGMDGSFTADVGDYTGPLFVEVTAGPDTTILDEVTGDFEDASNTMGVLLESVTTVTAGQPTTVNVTPFTSIVAQLAKQSAGNGNEISTLLVQQAQAAISTTLGFNPVATPPVNPRDAAASAAASPEARKQAVLLAALAELGNTSPSCDGIGTRADELACGARQYVMAYEGSTITEGAATISVNGAVLEGFTQAVSNVSADPMINTTGTSVDPATDFSTSTLASAEQMPNMPQMATVPVPEEGFNANDIAAVRTLFNNLRSNAAALDNDQLNDPVRNQLTNFASSINTQTFGLDFGTIELLNGTAQAGALFQAYFNAPDPQNRPTTSVIGGFGIVGTTACQVFAGVAMVDEEEGVVRSSPPPANSSGTPNGQSVGCTIFGPAVVFEDFSFAQIRYYTSYTLAQSPSNTLVVNSDSRYCEFPTGYRIGIDEDTCIPEGTVLGGVGGTDTTARMTTAMNGDMNVFFSGKITPPIDFATVNGEFGAATLADEVSVAIDFTGNDSATAGFFRGNGSITSILDGNTLTASFTDIDATGSEDENGNLIGSLAATGTVESDSGVLTGTFEADNTTANRGTINFSGSLSLGEAGMRAELFGGTIALTESVGTTTTPSVDTATFSGTFSLPERPILQLNLQLSETFGTDGSDDAETLMFTYQQGGTTVIFSGETDSTGAGMVTFSSPTSMVTVGPFDPETTAPVDVLRDGRKAGEYLVQDARINYADGSFEQF